MNLLSLGHSCFLLEMSNSDGEEVRILGDPWLSDHVIGDLMGRAPRVRLDTAHFPRVHGIWLSHSHTDHFDPYTLIKLWRDLPHRPRLLLPQSLEYLLPLVEEFLPGGEALLLGEGEPQEFHGLEVSALFNMELRATNEDDVMMLLVESHRELFLAEADAIFPYGDPEAREAISRLLANPSLETACFLGIRNELRSLMASVHAKDRDDRAELVDRSRAETLAEIEEMYQPLEEIEHDLWLEPRLLRFIGGQGICFPQQLGTDWNRVLFPLPLEERVRMEQEVASEHDLLHQVHAFLPGELYHLAEGERKGTHRPHFIQILDDPEDFRYDGEVARFEDFPEAPLCDERRDVRVQMELVQRLLNERFLPWFIGRRDPPVEHLLSTHGGEYRIRVRFGRTEHYQEQDWVIGFAHLGFTAGRATGDAQETYWANDLEDFFAGRADDFSTFCRRPIGEAQHFWDCLGMPYLNNDLVMKKLRFHFENAVAGRSLEEWVIGHYGWMR